MATDITTLKNWFKTGLKPTQAQFWSWIDSYWHKDEKLPISNIENLENVLNSKASDNHSHSEYATNDATSLTDENTLEWQKKLKISDLKFDDKSITVTQDYSDFGLQAGATINSFNNSIYQTVGNKIDAPTEEGSTENYPYVVGLNDDNDSVKLPAGDLGKNFANTDLVVSSKRKHTGTAGVEFGMPLVFSNANQKFSALLDKSADATFNALMGLDSNGNAGKLIKLYNLLNNGISLMTTTEKVNIMKLFNGQYSTGQITTNLLLMPIIIKSSTLSEYSIIRVIGTNLLIDPDISYVNIKEQNNTSNFSSCKFINSTSTELLVYVPNDFVEANKKYVLDIKHGVQLHTTSEVVSCIDKTTEYDLSTLKYSTINRQENIDTPTIVSTIDGNTVSNKQIVSFSGGNAPVGSYYQKIKTNSFATPSDNFIIEFDINWGYSTGSFEVYNGSDDIISLSKDLDNSNTKTIISNAITGAIVGRSGNNSYNVTGIVGGSTLVSSGLFKLTIIKQDTRFITIIEHSSGAILYRKQTAIIIDNFSIDYCFVVRGAAKNIGNYTLNSIKKF